MDQSNLERNVPSDFEWEEMESGSEVTLRVGIDDKTERDRMIHLGDRTVQVVDYKPVGLGRNDLEIAPMLVLSTAHISKSTDSMFEMNTDDVPTFYPKKYWDGEQVGYFIPIVSGHDWPHTCPDELLAIRKLAEASGCSWIMLDRDGETVEGLKTWDW